MIKQIFLAIIIFVFLNSCNTSKKVATTDRDSPNLKQELLDDNTFKITLYSQDKTYGYTEKNPIMVGGDLGGPKNERRFLNALAGPKGEEIKYSRIGSCCSFQTKNSELGGGLLDKYSVTYEGLEKSLVIYINMYDSDTLKVPVGLKLRY